MWHVKTFSWEEIIDAFLWDSLYWRVKILWFTLRCSSLLFFHWSPSLAFLFQIFISINFNLRQLNPFMTHISSSALSSLIAFFACFRTFSVASLSGSVAIHYQLRVATARRLQTSMPSFSSILLSPPPISSIPLLCLLLSFFGCFFPLLQHKWIMKTVIHIS